MGVKTKPTVQLVSLPNAVNLEGRSVAKLAIGRCKTVGALVRKHATHVHRPQVLVNGAQVSLDTKLRNGDVVLVRTTLAEKFFRAVLPIALLAIAFFAPYITAWVGATLGVSALAASAIVFAGTLVLGMLAFSMLKPPDMSRAGVEKQEERYIFSGNRNRTREFEPFLLVIGKMRVAPDYSGKPYGRFINQEQYLWQSFCFGLQDDLIVEDLRIGKAPISSFDGMTYTFDLGRGGLPAEYGNVDAQQGVELKPEAGWVTFSSAAQTVAVGIDLVAVAYTSSDRGDIYTGLVRYSYAWRELPNGTWRDLSNVIYGNGINQNRQSVDIPLPNAGTYELRVRMDTAYRSDSRGRTTLAVSSVRFHQVDAGNYEGQKRLGIKARASNKLSGVLDGVNALCHSNIPHWNGSVWEVTGTSNPAAWLLWFMRGRRDGSGNLLYGCGLPDTKIDFDAIKSFTNWCANKRLSANMVIDRPMSRAQVLDLIARCGRGRVTWQSGKLGVVWDAADTPVTAVFGPANIVAGSFKVNYITDRMSDEVIVNFKNKEKDYDADSVRVVVPGVINPSNPVSIDYIGCTDPDMARRDANLMAASQIYHRKHVEWETDVEGVICGVGDVVRISHDMTGWSQSGRVVRQISQTEIELDAEVDRPGIAMLQLRYADGAMQTLGVDSVNGRVVTVRGLLTQTDADQDCLWFYNANETPGKLFKINNIETTSEGGMRFTAAPHVSAYYDAENKPAAYVPPALVSPSLAGGLLLAQTSASAEETFILDRNGIRHPQAIVRWLDVVGAARYTLEWRARSALAWDSLTQTGTEATLTLPRGDYVARVAAENEHGGRSQWSQLEFSVLDEPERPDNVHGLTATVTTNGILVKWGKPISPEYVETELRVGPTANASDLVTRKSSQTHLTGWLASGVHTFWARNWGKVVSSAGWVSAKIDISDPAKVNISDINAQFNAVTVNWEDAKTDQPILSYEIRWGDAAATFDTAVSTTNVGGDSRSHTIVFATSGPKRVFVRAQDVAGNLGQMAVADVTAKMPNNFSLLAKWNALDGNPTLVNAAFVDGGLHVPVDVSQTWRQHFSSRNWATIQDQISAGFDSYAMPTPTSGSVTETHDIGRLIPIGIVSASIVSPNLLGAPQASTKLWLSADGVSWGQPFNDVLEVSAKQFRYVKIEVLVTGAGGDDLIHIDAVDVSIKLEELTEFGKLLLNPADGQGTFFPSAKQWADMVSANVTPIGSPNIARTNVNIEDAGGRQGVYVQAWDSTGARTGGQVSIQIGGF